MQMFSDDFTKASQASVASGKKEYLIQTWQILSKVFHGLSKPMKNLGLEGLLHHAVLGCHGKAMLLKDALPKSFC